MKIPNPWQKDGNLFKNRISVFDGEQHMTKIKICGIKKKEEIEMLNRAKVDYAGFVFYEKSKRYIEPEIASEIAKGLSKNIKKVAVTVSPDANLAKKAEDLGFDILQVHKELKKEVLESTGIPIWRAVNISDIEEYEKEVLKIDNLPYDLRNRIEAIVVDAPSYGSGRPFNWKRSRRLKKAGTTSPPDGKSDYRFVLAGGLSAGNVAEGMDIFKPDIVDVSSSVEGDNGKEEDKINVFVSEVRKHDCMA